MNSSVARFACLAAVLLVAIYAFVTLRGPQGLPALFEKRRDIREMERRNLELHREIEAKRQRIRRLQENQSDQELEIRDRLKLVKPGEKVFILQETRHKAPR